MFDDIAIDVATRQYAQPGEGIHDIFRRASEVVRPTFDDPKKADDFVSFVHYAMRGKKFSPGGRILAGAGTTHGNLLNCFVQDESPYEPGTTEGALHLAKKLAVVTRVGGGNGLNLDAYPAKREYTGPVGKAYIYHKSDSNVPLGRYTDLVTGNVVVSGYKELVPVSPSGWLSVYSDEVIVVPDSTEGIWDAAATMVKLLLKGKDVLIDVSQLRPEGSPVSGSGGTSSGPASFAVEIFDNFARWASLGGADYAGPVATLRYVFAPTLRVIRQGGVRRGAGMATLSASHPDLLDFLTAKTLEREREEGDIGTFNISVLADDEFMGKMMAGNPQERGLMHTIAEQAWSTGEPGLIFVDTINQHNMLYPTHGPIRSTNPCFSGDTIIETEFGPTPIKDIKEPTWVYTMDHHGKLDIALATAAWMTREKAETLTLRFNNGRELTVTPDHLIYVDETKNTDAGWVKAQDLVEGDVVVGFCRARRGAKYSGVKLSSEDNRAYRMEHRFVYEGMYGAIPEGYDVHHIDGDTYNNSLDNLELLTHSEHATLTRHSVPNDHMVNCPDTGKFISTESSKRGAKTIVQVPDHLATKWPGVPRIVSITKGPEIPVYDISVPGYGNVIANGIVAHNCGEIPLYPGEPCDLGAVNLAEYVVDGIPQYRQLEDDACRYAEYLDRILDVEVSPLQEIHDAIQSKRRIGLGMMGLADALIKMGIRYDSEEGLDVAATFAAAIRDGAYRYTTTVAANQGRTAPSDVAAAGFNRRNVACLTVAPTGTTAMVMGTTSGIEPLFAPFIYRRIGTEYKQILHPLFKEELGKFPPHPARTQWGFDDDNFQPQGWNWEEVTRDISNNHGSVQGIPYIPEEVQDLFVCAHDIDPLAHVAMQSNIQRTFDWKNQEQTYLGNSISKTINLPQKATVQDVLDVYTIAWTSGIKGITVYRDGSRDLQVLNTSLEDDGSSTQSQADDEQLGEILAATCSLDGTCE